MRLLVAAFLLYTLSCTKHKAIHPEVLVEKDIASDFKIPKDFINKIKDSLGKEVKTEPEFIFTTLDVELYTDQENVLKIPYVRIKLPNGGGRLDLSRHLTGQGSFYLSFPADQFANPQITLENIFYISESPKVKIEGEQYGLGCGQWIDLKSKLKDLQKRDFLKLNTFGERYLHVAAGQYIVVQRKGMQFFLSHLNLTDSRFTDKLCSSIFLLNK